MRPTVRGLFKAVEDHRMTHHRAAVIPTEQREADDICGPAWTLWLSDAGGLTQFGALVEVLQPGSRSSLRHWHHAEDELVYVLEGTVTVVEGDDETVLSAGDVATFQAGVPIGHFLINKSPKPTRCLVVGTRAPVDTIVYPDHHRLCRRDRSLPDDIWTDPDGNAASNPHARPAAE
jgi:uncharacterized cupin superfamily protein